MNAYLRTTVSMALPLTAFGRACNAVAGWFQARWRALAALACALVLALACLPAAAQIITTVAGTGARGFSGDNGPATSAQLRDPTGVAVDALGNMYIADFSNHRIRKVDVGGNITTVAGTGTTGFNGDNVAATTAQLSSPYGVAVDGNGNLYIADTYNHRIRKVDTNGTITTVAGTGLGLYDGDSGPATSASLRLPFGVAVDNNGDIYIADSTNSRIRKVSGGIITTVAGTGAAAFGGDGGPATSAQLNSPSAVAVDGFGNLYIADTFNSRIRKVSGGTITTIAGTGSFGFGGDGGPATAAQLDTPFGVAVYGSGVVYIADRSNHRVRKVASSGIITTVAGTGSSGSTGDGGPATSALLSFPQGLGVDASGNLYIAATDNQRIRFVAPTAAPGAPTGIAVTAGDGQATITFTAPSGNGGAAITTYTATASPGGNFGTCAGPTACSITVTGLTNGTAYTFTVTATNSAGTGAASDASAPATLKGDQTITFANPGVQNFGTTPTLSATASSGLAVTFGSTTPSVCTVTSGGVLTFITVGSCAINAAQTGDGTWNPATRVSQSFAVNAVAPGAPTIGTATAGNGQATVTFTAPANNGGAAITTYTATASPGGLTGTCAGPAACSITVTGLTNGTAYTFTVTATNSVGTGAASAASNAATPVRSNQTITFANPGAQSFGATPTLTASASSGLAVVFSSSTPGVCTASGNVVSFVGAGSCTIAADQPGNASWNPATTVQQTFAVNAVASASGTVPGMVGTATATLSGGGAGCTLEPANTRFMVPGTAPANRTLPHGAFEFRALGCTGSVNITLVYPEALPVGVSFWKFGPSTAGAVTSTWFAWAGATLSPDRRTVNYTIADNGVGDADPAVGTIRDPIAPAIGADPATSIPVDNPWALALLAAALGVMGWRTQRRGRVQ